MELSAKFKMVSDSKKIGKIGKHVELEFETPSHYIGSPSCVFGKHPLRHPFNSIH
jgi:hypothetical protein